MHIWRNFSYLSSIKNPEFIGFFLSSKELTNFFCDMFRLPLYLAVSLTTVLLAGGCSPLQPETFPNIIYILADDLGYGDLSALNRSSKIPTPAMDRIAHEGITFTDAHSPSAVCTPTRYGVLTGQYCFRTSLKSGVLVGYSPQLIDHERLTVAELLQRAGYHTACIGKWHLGLDWPKKDSSMPLIDSDGWGRTKTSNINYEGYVGGPNEHGFDYSFIIPASLDIIPYVYIRDGRLTGPVNDTIPGYRQRNLRSLFLPVTMGLTGLQMISRCGIIMPTQNSGV